MRILEHFQAFLPARSYKNDQKWTKFGDHHFWKSMNFHDFYRSSKKSTMSLDVFMIQDIIFLYQFEFIEHDSNVISIVQHLWNHIPYCRKGFQTSKYAIFSYFRLSKENLSKKLGKIMISNDFFQSY